jgi:hypothetical protein
MFEEIMGRRNNAQSYSAFPEGELSDDSLEMVVGGLQRVWTSPFAPLHPGSGTETVSPPIVETPLLS